MKKLIFLIPVFLVLAFAFPALAAKNSVGAQTGTQIQQQDRVQDPTTHTSAYPSATGSQVKNTNQVSTQNMGESTKLMVATSEMEQLMEEMPETTQVGAQVRTIAQEQVQAQAEIQTQLAKMESKSNFLTKLFGPDFGAIKNLKEQMEQNRLRIQTLTELQTQVTNQADETQLETAIQALIDQNTSLEDQISTKESIRSLFGWFVKLFTN